MIPHDEAVARGDFLLDQESGRFNAYNGPTRRDGPNGRRRVHDYCGVRDKISGVTVLACGELYLALFDDTEEGRERRAAWVERATPWTEEDRRYARRREAQETQRAEYEAWAEAEEIAAERHIGSVMIF